jgi:hypothetical protein
MAVIPGNLPTDVGQPQSTTAFFNNYYTQTPSVSAATNDTVVAYFQSITGDVDAGKTLAAAVIYTATQQNLDPVGLVQELKKLSDKNLANLPVITPLTETVITEYNNYQDVLENLTSYPEGQLFYLPELDIFYKSTNGTIVSPAGYQAQKQALQGETVIYNFSFVSYTAGKYSQRTSATADDPYAKPGPSVAYNSISEVNAYLTMFLNLNRSGTSLLGLSNSPLTSKYITRTILA